MRIAKKSQIVKIDSQKYALEFMIKLVDKYDFFFCIETYEKSLTILDYLFVLKSKYEKFVLFALNHAVLKVKCKKYFLDIWEFFLEHRYSFDPVSFSVFKHVAERDCELDCVHDIHFFC